VGWYSKSTCRHQKMDQQITDAPAHYERGTLHRTANLFGGDDLNQLYITREFVE
jgi:hypothetical protein